MTLRRILGLLLVLMLAVVPAAAQSGTDQNVNIFWPPPVFTVSGRLTILGTANPPRMSGYFLEFRRLADASTAQADSVPWSPAILPTRAPVISGVLGVWDSTQIEDGLYELRLSVFTDSSQPIRAVVSPLRVLNHPPQFAASSGQIIVLPDQPTPVFAFPTPTLFAPQPTAAGFGNPVAVAVIDANVRSGDSTIYPTVGALLVGEPAPLLGVSSRGSGWWLIALPDGKQGWIAPSTVRVSGNLGSVPAISPPPPPTPTATPTPIATATPQPPNATITRVHFDRAPKQGEPFNVVVTVLNASLNGLPAVSVACNFTPMNTFVSQSIQGLGAFGQIDVNIPVTLSSGGGTSVTANCAVDVNNLVAESNESDNFFNLTATLAEP